MRRNRCDEKLRGMPLASLRDALREEGQESGMEFYDVQGLGLGVG